MKYQLREKDQAGNKIGPHRIGNKKYYAGDVLESSMPLDKLFRGKFVRVADSNVSVSKPEIVKLPKLNRSRVGERIEKTEAVAVAGGEEKATESSPPSLPVKEDSVAPAKSEHGVDVTDEFPDAELAAMKIYHSIKTDSYIVVDGKSDEVLKRSKSDKLVVKFLKSQLG